MVLLKVREGIDRQQDDKAWWAGYQATVILCSTVVVLAVVSIVEWGIVAGWSDASDAGQFFQSLVTIAALTISGAWALYIFERGRTHAAFVEVRLEVVGFAERPQGWYAVVGVVVKNTGRVQFETQLVQVEAEFFDNVFMEQQLRNVRIVGASTTLRRRSSPLEGSQPLPVRTRNVFNWEQLRAFEPGQEAHDEVLVSLRDYPVATVEARYVGWIGRLLPQKVSTEGMERWRTRKSYSTRVILDPKTVSDGENSTSRPAGTTAVE